MMPTMHAFKMPGGGWWCVYQPREGYNLQHMYYNCSEAEALANFRTYVYATHPNFNPKKS